MGHVSCEAFHKHISKQKSHMLSTALILRNHTTHDPARRDYACLPEQQKHGVRLDFETARRCFSCKARLILHRTAPEMGEGAPAAGNAGAAWGKAAGRTAAGRGDSGSASLRARSSLRADMPGLTGAGCEPGAAVADGSSKGAGGDPGLLPSPEPDAASMAAVIAAVYAGSSPTAVTFVGWTPHSELGGATGQHQQAALRMTSWLCTRFFWGTTLLDLGAASKLPACRHKIHDALQCILQAPCLQI